MLKPKLPKQSSSQNRTRSWINGIPLGSLDQLQNAPKKPDPIVPEDANAVSVALPESRPSTHHSVSTQRTGGADQAVNDAQDRQDGIPSTEPQTVSPDDASARTANTPGSLWLLEHPSVAPELLVPLPESTTALSQATQPVEGTIDSHSELYTSSQPPLQAANGPDVAAEQAAQYVQQGAVNTTDAETITAQTTGGLQQSKRKRKQKAVPVTYWDKVQHLAPSLPHIKSIWPDRGRHDVGQVTCIDYFTSVDQPTIHRKLHQSHGDFLKNVGKLASVADSAAPSLRVVLVEDLSPALIATLGLAFEIDPEIFAEHLNRSGYDHADYEEDPPTRWKSSSLPKSYATMKWYRPVKENPRVSRWLKTPAALLRQAREPEDSDEEESVDDTERIPSVITWSHREMVKSQGKPLEKRYEHLIDVGTNIFRESWPLSTRPISKVEDVKKPTKVFRRAHKDKRAKRTTAANIEIETTRLTATPGWEHRGIPTAWEEKASCFSFQKSDTRIVIILLDPIPQLRHRVFFLEQHKDASGERIRTECQDPEDVDMALPIVPRLPPDIPSNKFHASADDVGRFKKSIGEVVSSRLAIRNQLQQANPLHYGNVRVDPILALLRIVQSDSKAFFQMLEWALDEISQDSLDDYLMTRRLAEWRSLMSDFEIEVPAIGHSLRNFVDYIFDDPNLDVPEQINTIISDINQDIARVKQRLDDAYAALRADMQFTESRRSIAEAKTVTRLTELAFLFIPLSFTCSLFSMQIRELGNGVPVWTFIVTAIAIAILSYGIRVILTSDLIARTSRRALERFWARRDVRRGDNAPTLTLVSLTILELWRSFGASVVTGLARVLGFLLLSSLMVLPIVFVWNTTNLATGFNVAMTLFVLFSGWAMAWIIFVGGGGSLSDALPNFLHRSAEYGSDTSGEDV